MSQTILETVETPVQVNQTPAIGEQLRYKTARAAMTSGGSEAITRVLTVVLAIVTARTLEPVEVGLLGLSVIVIGVVSMLGFYPETAAITARSEGTNQQYALAATTIRIGITVVFLTALWLTFPVVARYLTGKDDGAIPLRELLSVLAWVPVLELISGYPQVVMQRRLDLNFIAWLQILQPILFVGSAVALLLTGHGYIGVAWASVSGSAVIALLLWLRLLSTTSAGWRVSPSRVVWRETLRGTVKILVGGFGGYLGARVDNLLVAGSIGPAAMSFYSMAWNASRTPANVFAKAISFVLVPALARIQDDPSRVQRALRECVRNSYLMLAPICAILFVSAPILVSYVIGSKWLPLVPALRVMCFAVLAVPLLFASGALLVGTGRAHLTGIATVVQLITLGIAIPPLSARWGVLGAAYGDLVAVLLLTITLCTTAWLSTRQINWSILNAATLPVLAAAGSGSVAFWLSESVAWDLARLSLSVSVTILGYVLILVTLGGRAKLIDLTRLLRSVVGRQSMAAESQT